MNRRLTPDEFRAKVQQWGIPPESIVLPRAEVEALRARAERLRRILLNDFRIKGDGPRMTAFRELLIEEGNLYPGDLADDLRTLDEMPPLKLADNPLDNRER